MDQHHAALRRIARLFVSSSEVADEVVQETWLAVIRGVWAFEGRSTLKTWILRILINRAKTHASREGRTVPFAEVGNPEVPEGSVGVRLSTPAGGAHDLDRVGGTAVPDQPPEPDRDSWLHGLRDPEPSPEARLLTREARARVREAIDALPANQRVVITMRDLEGCTGAEVCNVLGLSETNQRVILHRARTRLRSMLAVYFLKE